MDKNKALVMLTKYHKEYIQMAKVIGNNDINIRNYAEDFVQEAYLKLSRYEDLYDKVITKKGKVSKGYMFFVLRSIIVNHMKKKSNLKYSYLSAEYDFEEKYNMIDYGIDEELVAVSKVEDKLYNVLKKEAKWFDYELFKKYLKSRKSYDNLSLDTGIGVRTIYMSIKRCKLIIAEHLFEDYMDLLNGDYDKL